MTVFGREGSGVKEWKMRICNRWGELVWWKSNTPAFQQTAS